MIKSKHSLRSGFDVVIRPAPEGAGRTTPEQTGHYSHYNAKLANSLYMYIHGNSCRIALTKPPRPSCSWKSSGIVNPFVINKCNRKDCTKWGA